MRYKSKIYLIYILIYLAFTNIGVLNSEEEAKFKSFGLSFSQGRGNGLRDNGYFYAENYFRKDDVISYNFYPYILQPTGNLLQNITTIHNNLVFSVYFARYFFWGLGFLESSNYAKQDRNILYTFLLYQANQYTENQTLKSIINLSILSDRILETNHSGLFRVTYQMGFIYEYENFFMKLKLNANAIGGKYGNPGRYFYFPSIVLGFSLFEKSYYFFLEPYYGIQTRGSINNSSLVESGFFVGVEIRK